MNVQEVKQPIFSLRFRLILMVTAELVASVLLALWVSNLLDRYLPADLEIPFLLYLVVASLLVGILVTSALSRMFFAPIKKVRQAMAMVEEGDYTVTLPEKSESAEIQDIYSGFNLMTKELRSTEILQSDFVSNVSHEFKTPINAIEGYATLLQGCEGLTPEQRGYVDKIIHSTERLSALTGSILLLSKLENQQIPTNRSHFSLDEQIRQSIVAQEPAWEKKDLEFEVELDAVTYYGCEHLLRHVWSNLLSNAIKFSPQNGTIRILLVSGPEQVVFTIDDCGPGIAEDAIDHIFQKFYQADSSHKQEGNGLGLSLVDKILKQEKGSIAVENLSGGGCRFTVTLENRK